MAVPQWIENLKTRWNITSTTRVFLILLVFACTGTTVLVLKQPLFAYWFPEGEKSVWATIAYYVLILPVYNIFLLIYGFVFGQFRFFWEFEKKFFGRIVSKFRKTKS